MSSIVYQGDEPTIHPELGELVPGVRRELPERDVPAALRAQLAGLPLEVELTDEEHVELYAGDSNPDVIEEYDRREAAGDPTPGLIEPGEAFGQDREE